MKLGAITRRPLKKVWAGPLLFCVMILSGCSTYLIDSNPRGLRVSVDNVELGVTPCEYTWEHGGAMGWTKVIRVTPPNRQQMRDYEKRTNKIVSTWVTSEIAKTIYSEHGGGTVFFQFVTNEYDQPQTPEDVEWVKNAMQQDAEHLEEQRELILKQK